MLRRAEMSWPHGPRLFPIGALTIGLRGRELAPMAELRDAGCVAFSNDGEPVADTEIFRRALEYAADLAPVIDHCEDPFMPPGPPRYSCQNRTASLRIETGYCRQLGGPPLLVLRFVTEPPPPPTNRETGGASRSIPAGGHILMISG